MGRYRFALRPRWILSHLLVVLLVVVMVNLGLWQLRRLDEKRDLNALVRQRGDEPVVAVDEVVDAGSDFDSAEADAAAWRRVSVTGTYDGEREVMVRSRSLDERPGVWVLTPLVTASGDAVVVNRGFIPTQGVLDRVPDDAAAAAGTVTATGLLQANQSRGRFGATDPADGTLVTLARADLARLQDQVPYNLYPVYLQLEEQDPSVGTSVPELLPEPDLTEGPHLSYAVQWFCFSAIALVGYVLILRRQADREGSPRRSPAVAAPAEAGPGGQVPGEPLPGEVDERVRSGG